MLAAGHVTESGTLYASCCHRSVFLKPSEATYWDEVIWKRKGWVTPGWETYGLDFWGSIVESALNTYGWALPPGGIKNVRPQQFYFEIKSSGQEPFTLRLRD